MQAAATSSSLPHAEKAVLVKELLLIIVPQTSAGAPSNSVQLLLSCVQVDGVTYVSDAASADRALSVLKRHGKVRP